jgi:hypothetical protein
MGSYYAGSGGSGISEATLQTYINSTGTSPSVNDDVNAGKFIGSVLTSESDGAVYVCTDASAGAAVWLKVSQSDSELSAAADAAEDAAGVYTDTATAALGYPRITSGNETLVATFDPMTAAQSSTQTANSLRGQRIVIPKTGNLRDLSVFIGATSGNIEAAVYDTGEAAASTTITRLWASGSVAAGAGNTWQVIGDPNLAVTRGQHLFLTFGADNSTVTVARGPGNFVNAAFATYPFDLNGSGLQVRRHTFNATTAFTAPATIATGSLNTQNNPTLIIGRIS